MPNPRPGRAFDEALANIVRAHAAQMEINMPLHDPNDFRVLNQALPLDHLPNIVLNPRPIPRVFEKPAIFWGGSDVDPGLYGRPVSRHCGGTNRQADEKEAAQMRACIDMGHPIIGICRGAQLLNVVNGGILVQDVDGHAILGEHPCRIVWDGADFECGVSSTHHQMMVAHQDGIIIGKGPATTGYHWNDVETPYAFKYTTEVVYYPKTKSLCVQPHPEWMDQDKPFIKWLNYFIHKEFGMAPLDFTHEEKLHLRGRL